MYQAVKIIFYKFDQLDGIHIPNNCCNFLRVHSPVRNLSTILDDIATLTIHTKYITFAHHPRSL